MHHDGDWAFCGGGVCEALVELDYRYRGTLYIFREVPAGVCQQCGEQYLQAQTAKVLEQAMQSQHAWSETIAVPVTTFPAMAGTAREV